MVAADEVRVLALPSDTGAVGEGLLHQRRGVDEDLHVVAGGRGKGRGELFEASLHQVVIIDILCVHGNRRVFGMGERFERVVLGAVVQADDEG